VTSKLHHPYWSRPLTAFWKSAVAEAASVDFDPIVNVPFTISKTDKIATAGSCFAQHISKALIGEGIGFLQYEKADSESAGKLPVYSARYGNIYTTRQLKQLFQRAYGIFTPKHAAWRREDGRYVDPFRPNEFEAGFEDPRQVSIETKAHLAAVRQVFENCDVFIYTLGLTEVWICDADGAALPLPPGVIAAPEDETATFTPTNLSVSEMTEELSSFIDDMRLVNPNVRFILTVSPVPMVATFNDRHVILSNTYSKSALRVVAQNVSERQPGVLYFPSYEMIASHPKINFFEENLRSVKPEGVSAVISLFKKKLFEDTSSSDLVDCDKTEVPSKTIAAPRADRPTSSSEFKGIMCDEEMLGTY
jgi:hypothetical protein